MNCRPRAYETPALPLSYPARSREAKGWGSSRQEVGGGFSLAGSREISAMRGGENVGHGATLQSAVGAAVADRAVTVCAP